jgi:phenylacetate-CoA ligase
VLRELKQQQYLSKEALNEIRTKRFNHIFQLAKTSTTYYKNSITYDALEVLTKDTIRAHYNELISSSYKKKLFPKGTGGSTGTPLIYLTTIEAKTYMWAGLLLSWEIAGYEFGDKVAFVAGTSLIKNDFRHMIFHKILNVDSYSTYTLNDSNILTYIKKLQRSKTNIIFGYPTALNIIATYIHKNGPFAFPYLKGIVSSAEVMTEANRTNISRAFNVEVYNQYGCNEAGISAFECDYGKMHLINTASSIELHKGELYGTNLINDAFYFIKYATGDTIEMSNAKTCPCKRGYPIIEKVNGRAVDIIIDKNGKKVHSSLFSILFRSMPIIEQYQVQFDKTSIEIYLKLNEPSLSRQQYDQVLKLVKKEMSFDECRIYYNSAFLQSANAKHKYVIDNRARQNVSHENLV